MTEDTTSSFSALISQPEFIKQETAKVVIGGITTGVGGMTIGSLLAVQKNLPATIPGLTMCIKTWSFGTAFFALRQFIVNPFLQTNRFPTTSAASNRHFQGLLPTAISAAIIGGSVNGYIRGRQVIGRSGLTTSLVCCTLQIVYNEIGNLGGAMMGVSSPIERERPVGTAAWWERWIPLTKISDEDWKQRVSVELAQKEVQLRRLSGQIDQLERAISSRRAAK